jgi:hypothetical protein
MWGAVIRAVIFAPIAALLAAMLSFIMARILPFLGPQDELLYRSFASVADHSLTVMSFAILMTLVASAVVERRVA